MSVSALKFTLTSLLMDSLVANRGNQVIQFFHGLPRVGSGSSGASIRSQACLSFTSFENLSFFFEYLNPHPSSFAASHFISTRMGYTVEKYPIPRPHVGVETHNKEILCSSRGVVRYRFVG